MSSRYQPEVDGLRAVAVLAVMAFHAAPAAFRGGFVGVDVFFVISGYLISGIVAGGLAAGTFTVAGFYERRARRILPALGVVLAAVAVASVAVLLPRDLAAMGKSLAGVATMTANLVFLGEAAYFGGASDIKPLLHTWSLAVEEQFYLGYPLLLLAVHRVAPAWTGRCLAALAIASLGACAWVASAWPNATYYLAPFRAWELLLGGLLAVSPPPPVRAPLAREALGVAGLAAIGASVMLVTPATPFPVPGAVPACLGAAALIHAAGSGPSRVGGLLASRPAVAIGLGSYSLYLWHWPLLALVRYASVPRPSPGAVATAVAGAFLLSAASWRWVEQPARRPGTLSRTAVLRASGAVLAAFAATGLAMSASGGWPGRFDPGVVALAEAASDADPRRAARLSDRSRWIPPGTAPAAGADVAPRTALWGDSHGAALLPAVAAAAERHGESVRFLGYSGMPPLVGARLAAGEGAREGHRYNDAAVAYILGDPSVRTVLLAARWARYVVGPVEDFGAEPAGWGGFGPTLLREGRRPSGEADALDAFAAHLRETVARLRAAGRRVVVVGPIPELGVEAPRALALLLARGQDPAGLVLPAASFEARQRGVLAALDALRDVERVNPHTRLRAGDGYGLLADGRPLYQDDDHLSLAGAARVSPAFDAVFAEEPAAIGTEAGRRATRD